MFKNYLLVAFRNIKKYRLYSFINIAGLAIGMACCILIFIWVLYETNYETFHENSDRLYRVIMEETISEEIIGSGRTPNALAGILKEEYPGIEDAVRYRGGFTGWLLKYGDKLFLDDRMATADPWFFDVFKYPFLKGNPKTALQERFSCVITERLAGKLFADEDPMGKVIKIGTSGVGYQVTGIIKNLPPNSHMQFDLMMPSVNMEYWWRQDLNSWKHNPFHTFVLLKEGVSADDLNQKIAGVIKRHYPETKCTRIYLQPLSDVHLRSNFRRDEENIGQGDITYVYIFSLIAAGVLLIACFNFMNLSTARFGKRAKEIGLRKVVGADRKDIMKQFMSETIVLSFIALLFAIILVFLFLPAFGALSDKPLSLNVVGNTTALLGLLGITLFTGVVSGIYPSFVLASFQPVKVLKGSGDVSKRSGGRLRKVLVISQFAFTIALIIGTTVIYNQLDFMRKKDLGFNKNNIVYFHGYGELAREPEFVKNELLRNPRVSSISKSNPPFLLIGASTELDWEGRTPRQEASMYTFRVDYDYIKTLGMKMAAGRFFSKEFPADTSNFVINEAAAEAMGMESPVGKWLSFRGTRGTIVGVVKDFHQNSLHSKIEPIVMQIYGGRWIYNIKISPDDVAGTLDFLKTKWGQFVPDLPFTYTFLDEKIAEFYKNEKKIGVIFRYFTFLTIFIACLGLLGLASFMAEQKTKEIGIRKVLGASVASIVVHFLQDFLKWVIIAMAVAFPAAWYGLDKWLQNFAYRTGIGWWVFVFAGVAAVGIAVFTVGFQAVKAASANPVDNLRYE